MHSVEFVGPIISCCKTFAYALAMVRLRYIPVFFWQTGKNLVLYFFLKFFKSCYLFSFPFLLQSLRNPAQAAATRHLVNLVAHLYC